MTRERTTWNRDEIKRTAAMPKQADPYLMNQDHVSKNPPADKYMNGNPSTWAEDVHSPNEWEKEYSGGATKRDEIGLPDFRPETFTHSEKTASEALLVKKADLAVKVARLFLPKASEAVVEDQAVALMNLPDSELIDTFQRLAQDEQGQQGQGEQQKQQAGQQEQVQEQAPAQQQQQAQQEQVQEPAQQQAGLQQQSAMQQCMEAAQRGDEQGMQAAVQQMVQEAMQQGAPSQQQQAPVMASKKKANQGQEQGQGQGEQQKQQAAAPVAMDQQAMASQIQSMVQQAVQQMMAQQGQQDQGQQAPPADMQQEAGDDQLLDDMLAPQTASAAGDMSGMGDIQLEPSPMDVGEVQLTADDDVLKTLFATQETQDAEEAQQSQGQQHQASVRTASTRTVGTRPSAGVSKVGGASAATSKTAGNEVDKLTNLWSSAPDVREHFGIR